MSLDRFVDKYIALVNRSIEDQREVLEKKDFAHKSDFTKVQGRLQGLVEALSLLRAIPEDD